MLSTPASTCLSGPNERPVWAWPAAVGWAVARPIPSCAAASVNAPAPTRWRRCSLMLSMTGSSDARAQGPERGAHLGREQLGLFPGREVPALVDLLEIDQVAVAALDPAARRTVDFAG